MLSRFPALFGAATHSCYAPCVRYTQQLLVHGQMGDGGASTLPTDNAGYLRAEYWDARFEHEAEYEWFRSYESFRHLVERECKPDDRVLVVGCGNSRMSEDLCTLSGLRNVCSTDASPTVVQRMRELAASRGCTAVAWQVADMLALPFADGSFDIVIEKGSIDCFMVDNKDPWNPLPEVKARVATVLSECHRVLSPAGALLSITFAAPHFRRPLLQAGRFSWRVRHDQFGADWHYYFYTARKGLKGLDEADDTPAACSSAPPHDMMQQHMDDEDYLLRAGLDD